MPWQESERRGAQWRTLTLLTSKPMSRQLMAALMSRQPRAALMGRRLSRQLVAALMGRAQKAAVIP